jgi:hypothetical protein
VGSNIVLTFNKTVTWGSGYVYIYQSSTGTPVAGSSIIDTTKVTFSGSTVTFNPPTDLSPSTSYYVTISSGAIKDLAGNIFSGITGSSTYTFTTGAGN